MKIEKFSFSQIIDICCFDDFWEIVDRARVHQSENYNRPRRRSLISMWVYELFSSSSLIHHHSTMKWMKLCRCRVKLLPIGPQQSVAKKKKWEIPIKIKYLAELFFRHVSFNFIRSSNEFVPSGAAHIPQRFNSLAISSSSTVDCLLMPQIIKQTDISRARTARC